MTVERGKEFFPETRNIEVGADPVTVAIPLRRWIDMAARGWYSGETHLHRTLDELRNVVLAEDLNVAFPMTYWITHGGTPPTAGDKNIAGEIPGDLIYVDEMHVIWPRNTEYEIFTVGRERHTLGALFLLNHRSAFERGVPPWGPVIEEALREGALFDMDKLDWPFSMTLPVLAKGALYELANNHLWRTEFAFTNWNSPAAPYLQPPFGGTRGNERDWLHYTLGMHYTLLNTGARIAPTTGTANGVHPVPAGFSRVYVPLADGFDYDAWPTGLREGRSFVTTGPMLFARVDGHHPGATFDLPQTAELTVEVEVVSEQPISFGEIVVNGVPRHLLRPQNELTPEGACRSRMSQTVSMGESGWLAVRVWEDRPDGRFRFAHTAPWYVTVDRQPVRLRREEKHYLTGRVQAEIDRSRHILPAEALVEYERALDHYQGLPVRDDSADVQRQSRPPKSEQELLAWLENMVRHHRLTPEEVRFATGMTHHEIAAALDRFSLNDAPAASVANDPIRILPYPGGRHPRSGFQDGAIDPQRDTKFSVFLPWEASGYVVVDLSEAIFSNLGLIYLAHTHIPTIWDRQGIELDRLEWDVHEDGSLVSERTLPNGIRFGARVVPDRKSVRMELWLHNGTPEKLTGLRVQNCVMLKGAPQFNAQTGQNKVLAPPFAAVGSEDGHKWIITAWEPNQRAWANPPVPSLHSDPILPDCEPGQTVKAVGRVWFYEGDDIQPELERLRTSDGHVGGL